VQVHGSIDKSNDEQTFMPQLPMLQKDSSLAYGTFDEIRIVTRLKSIFFSRLKTEKTPQTYAAQ
jgi:hypothetical protein